MHLPMPAPRRCRPAITLLLALLALGLLNGCTLPTLLYADAKEKRALAAHGKEYISVIQPTPVALTDELAVAKAREALAGEGYEDWSLTEVRTHGNRSVVRFTKDGRFRLYGVRLEGEQVLCHSFRDTQRDRRSWDTRPKPDHSVARGKAVAK